LHGGRSGGGHGGGPTHCRPSQYRPRLGARGRRSRHRPRDGQGYPAGGSLRDAPALSRGHRPGHHRLFRRAPSGLAVLRPLSSLARRRTSPSPGTVGVGSKACCNACIHNTLRPCRLAYGAMQRSPDRTTLGCAMASSPPTARCSRMLRPKAAKPTLWFWSISKLRSMPGSGRSSPRRRRVASASMRNSEVGFCYDGRQPWQRHPRPHWAPLPRNCRRWPNASRSGELPDSPASVFLKISGKPRPTLRVSTV